MSNVIEVVSESLTVEVTQGTSTTVGLAAPVGPQGPPGTTDFTQLQNVPSTFPPSSHTHASSEITDFNSAASSAAPVQSVAGRTGAVTLAVADVANAVSTSDARLSDPRSPTAHKSTHAIGGSDALSPADIGAATSAQGALADSAVQPGDLATVATSGSYTDLSDKPLVDTSGDAGSILTSGVLGGTGGNISTNGVYNGVGGQITTSGSYGGVGGSIFTNGVYDGVGGSIDTRGTGQGTSGGSIITKGDYGANGGTIDTRGVQDVGPGGSIITSQGGGSIDTRAQGTIELGYPTMRTTLTGTATSNRAIAFPNASGTLALTSHTHANATTSAAGFLSATDKTKLDGIESGAQVNTVTSVAGKTGAVSLAKADVGLGNVDNTLDLNKPISTATQAALNLKADATALSSHVGDTANPHAVTKAQVGLGNVDNTSDLNKPISTATQAALDGKQAAGSYATLVNGLVPSAQLPSFVDDVLEFANLAALPVSGETGKIYVTLDTNKTYRWSGSAYVEISPSPGSTDAVPEGSTNLYFTNARASAAAPVQSVAGKTGAVTLAKGDVGLGNVDNTSDLNKPVSTATQTALDGKVDKITGKGLSTEDFTSAEKSKLAGIESGAQVNVVTSVAGKTGAVTLAKGDVGLGNVDNTSDLNKPISTAAQTALDGKAATVHTHTAAQVTDFNSAAASAAPVQSVAGKTGTVILGKADVGLSNVDNTSDLNKPISTATQTALGNKAVKLEITAASTPSASPFQLNLQINKFYNVFKDTEDDCNLLLPTSASDGDVIVVRRLGGSSGGVLNVVRQGGTPFLQTIGQIGSSGQIFRAIWLGGWNAENPSVHAHSISEVTGLQAALDGKQAAGSYAAAVHTHVAANVTDFNSAAASAAPVQSVAGKTGTVTLAKGDVGLSNVDNTSDASKPVSTATQTALDGKVDKVTGKGLSTEDYTSAEKAKLAGIAAGAEVNVNADWTATTGDAAILNKPATFTPSAHTHVLSDVTGLQSALDGKQPSGSYATLVNGLVPANQLPSYVDDVVEVNGVLEPTGTGEAGKIYVTTTNSKVWRWSGSAYVEISASPGSTDAVPEGSTNLYFTPQRAANAAPVQSVAGRTGAVTLAKADVGLGNVDNTSDLNKPISAATQTALDGKQAAGSYAPATHSHAISDVTGLQAQLDVRPSYTLSEDITIPESTNEFSLIDVAPTNNATTRFFQLLLNGSSSTAQLTIVVGSNVEAVAYGKTTLLRVLSISPAGGTRRPVRLVRRNFVSLNAFTDQELDAYPASNFPSSTTVTVRRTNNTGVWELGGVEAHTHLISGVTGLQTALDGKVDKITGKGLSTEDFTSAEKTKLAGIAAGAEVNVNADWTATTGDAAILNKPTTFTPSAHTHVAANVTDFNSAASAAAPVQSVAGKTGAVTLTKSDVGLGNVANTAQVTSVTGTAPIVSSGGTTPAISISAATPSAAGSMSAADKLKLDGIASGAEVNVNADWNATSGDAAILNKPTTFTPSSHTHGNISNAGAIGTTSGVPIITGASGVLQAGSFGTTAGTFCQGNDSRLSDARTPTAHTHPIADVTNLQTSLDSKAASVHTHAISDVTGLQTALDGKQVAGSYATLVNGLVPSNQLPSFVDDVLEFANFAALPGSGESGKIYTTIDNNKIYRWSGSAYVEISASPGSTDAVPEGSSNLYFTNARASAAAPVQSVAGRTGAVTLTKADVGLSNVANTAQVTSVTGTAPIVSSGGTTPAISISPATTSTAGSMSAADYLKLLTIQTGAEANVNADWTATTGDAAILNKPATFPPSSHLHPASDISDSTFTGRLLLTAADSAAARTTLGLGTAATSNTTAFAAAAHTHGNITNAGAIGSTANLPVITTTSGVLTTGSFGTAANTFCQGNDSRLSDARTPTSHVHGNITNAGAIGSTSGVPIITGASGVLQAGSFGTTAGTFCQGNDSRLSDARTPTSHTHADATSSVAGFMSSTDKSKLDGIAAGAEVNVNADWNAASGDAQILNKPSIPAASSATPLSLGTASAGTASTFSRSDHRHAMPSASDVGAAASVGASDIEITDATKGVILRAPDGGRWRLTIDSTGILNTTRL